jgi:hypothetical protein
VITSITAPCTTQGTALQAHAQPLQHHLQQMMRRFGRQCRGMGNVCVTRVRQTETPRWERGRQVLPLARAVQQRLHRMPQLSEDQRARLDTQLTAALAAPQRIEHPSRRRTQGKMLPHGNIVNADDPTMAPICTGKSHGPAPFGRKPGMMAEPAAGCIVALHLPVGNPSDASDGEPLGDNVEQAIARVRTRPPRPSTRWLAIWRCMTSPGGRHGMSGGFSPWGSRKLSIPSPRRRPRRTCSRSWTRRTCTTYEPPSQVHLACACGYSRPVVESIMASRLPRGAARLTYKGHRGAIVQPGMAVMAHHAATLVRIHEYRLSKRARMFRRRLRLRCRQVNQCHASIN